VHVGIGWAYARLRLRPGKGSPAADPLLRWLAWDGFGFHQGFWHADRVIGGQRVERGLPPDTRAVRDQGLGRALWFHECAEPDGIALRIAEFGPDRRADLWSGIGLAATYDRIGRYALADRAYASAIRLGGETVEILNNQGYSYMLRGNYPEARKRFLRAYAREPNNPTVLNNLKLLDGSTRDIRRTPAFESAPD